jgi:F-type H+-transporting ATPase subunit delta
MASGDLSAARRYSRALFNVALQRNDIDAVADSLAVVTSTASGSPELLSVLEHPLVTRQRKNELLAKVFGDSVNNDVTNFLLLLVEKDRASIIPNVAREFARLVDEHRHVTDAEVTSAIALTDGQIKVLQDQLQASTGYTVRLQTKVDSAILGGLVVRVGDKLIDGSVVSQLQSIREQLKRVKVN